MKPKGAEVAALRGPPPAPELRQAPTPAAECGFGHDFRTLRLYAEALDGEGMTAAGYGTGGTAGQPGMLAPSLQRQATTSATPNLGSIGAWGALPEEIVSLWLLPQQCDPGRPLTVNDFVVDNSLGPPP